MLYFQRVPSTLTHSASLPPSLRPSRAGRDVVRFVHNAAMKVRQAYVAGEQTSAVSWGTGRAVARIPRASGGGTGRSSSAAFGDACRGGRLYAPTKVSSAAGFARCQRGSVATQSRPPSPRPPKSTQCTFVRPA